MESILAEVIKYAPAMAGVIIVTWLQARLQERRDQLEANLEGDRMKNFMMANERLAQSNERLAELHALHLTALQASLETMGRNMGEEHRLFREVVQRMETTLTDLVRGRLAGLGAGGT